MNFFLVDKMLKGSYFKTLFVSTCRINKNERFTVSTNKKKQGGHRGLVVIAVDYGARGPWFKPGWGLNFFVKKFNCLVPKKTMYVV